MDAGLSRSSIPERNDPHEWNTWDHYQTIHERRIAGHDFINHSKPNTLVFTEYEDEGVLALEGEIYCSGDVVLEVEKWFAIRYFGSLRKVRCFSYRYVAFVRGGNSLLRYHNVHSNDDDYHHRVFNPETGEQVLYERLERYQFPLLTEILDELELITRA